MKGTRMLNRVPDLVATDPRGLGGACQESPSRFPLEESAPAPTLKVQSPFHELSLVSYRQIWSVSGPCEHVFVLRQMCRSSWLSATRGKKKINNRIFC